MEQREDITIFYLKNCLVFWDYILISTKCWSLDFVLSFMRLSGGNSSYYKFMLARAMFINFEQSATLEELLDLRLTWKSWSNHFKIMWLSNIAVTLYQKTDAS